MDIKRLKKSLADAVLHRFDAMRSRNESFDIGNVQRWHEEPANQGRRKMRIILGQSEKGFHGGIETIHPKRGVTAHWSRPFSDEIKAVSYAHKTANSWHKQRDNVDYALWDRADSPKGSEHLRSLMPQSLEARRNRAHRDLDKIGAIDRYGYVRKGWEKDVRLSEHRRSDIASLLASVPASHTNSKHIKAMEELSKAGLVDEQGFVKDGWHLTRKFSPQRLLEINAILHGRSDISNEKAPSLSNSKRRRIKSP